MQISCVDDVTPLCNRVPPCSLTHSCIHMQSPIPTPTPTSTPLSLLTSPHTHPPLTYTPLTLTLSSPFIADAPIPITVPLALRCKGGEGRGLGFIRSLVNRSTLTERGNLRLVPITGEEYCTKGSLGLRFNRAVRIAVTATCSVYTCTCRNNKDW